MKKIKNNVSIIISFFVGLIISFLGTTYAATQIIASNVDFTPRDSSWNVDNAQAAINDLYYKVPGVPTGTILSIMGTTASTGYLICDGSTYNISSHTNLANYIKDQFGSYNYFGGDGTTTFKVPDLRGEFLRGSGTNSHTQSVASTTVSEGSGAAVGKHQASTVLRNIWHYDNTSTAQAIWYSNSSSGLNTNEGMENVDNWMVKSTYSRSIVNSQSIVSNTSNYVGFSTRPTNTSVLYIIKY